MDAGQRKRSATSQVRWCEPDFATVILRTGAMWFVSPDLVVLAVADLFVPVLDELNLWRRIVGLWVGKCRQKAMAEPSAARELAHSIA